MRLPSLILPLFFLVPLSAWAEDVDHLEGKTLRFSNGVTLKLGERLGAGSTSVIYALANDPTRAVRLPQAGSESFLRSTWRGYSILAKQGIPMVRLHESLPSKYIIVDRVVSYVSFRDFLSKENNRPASESIELTPGQISEMEKDFLKFAETTAPLSSIGDFSGEQIVYDLKEKRWVLLDWTNSSRLVPADQISTAKTAMNQFFLDSNIGRVVQEADGSARCVPSNALYPKFIPICEAAIRAIQNKRLQLTQRPASVMSCLLSSVRRLIKN